MSDDYASVEQGHQRIGAITEPRVLSGRTVLVVGGGAIGISAAYYLRRLGGDVTVVDQGQIGHGASFGNAGWIVPSLSRPLPAPGIMRDTLGMLTKKESPLYIRPRFSGSLARWFWEFSRASSATAYEAGVEALGRLNMRTMQLFDELHQDRVDFPMFRRGLLFAFLSRSAAEKELNHLRASPDYGYDIPLQTLTGEQLRQIEPALSTNVQGGFHAPNERHLEPVSFTAAVAKRFAELGGNIREHESVLGFETSGSRVTGVRTDAGVLHADFVLVATGAQSARLLKLLRLRLPLEGGKGYSFSIASESMPKHPLYLGEAKIGCSPLTKELRIAGTMELSGLNSRLDKRRIDVMVNSARRYLVDPLEADLNDQWAGLRPLTPDGLPVMDRLDPFCNVFLSTGHNTLGITLAPASGRAMADFIGTSHRPDVLSPFSWSRFGKNY
jgi:D-amino-acid dehydrogenase